jgi:hypothetical protein
MPGTITISTLSDGTNSTSATNPILGSAKAWVNFQGAATPTVRSSFNVSSVTYVALGFYNISFTNAMPNTNYVTSVTTTQSNTGYVGGGISGLSSFDSYTTTQCRIVGVSAVTGYFDAFYFGVIIFSS